jgi:hypothetical protein
MRLADTADFVLLLSEFPNSIRAVFVLQLIAFEAIQLRKLFLNFLLPRVHAQTIAKSGKAITE